MIAEKPSIAKNLADSLGGKNYSSKRMGKLNFHRFNGYFKGIRASITVSSVAGHVYGTDFTAQHNKWDAIEISKLYDVDMEKREDKKNGRISQKIGSLARGMDILCLWLDCDKEGENICYEVLYNCFNQMNRRKYQQVYRAKFSSLTPDDLRRAYNNISSPPNLYDSLFVDARQVK